MDKKYTIGNVTAGLMIVLALIVDGLQILLTLTVLLIPLSLLLTFFSVVGFSIWFFLLGAYKGKGAEKKVLTSLAASVVEIVPVLSAIPAATAGVVINIVLSRMDDLKRRIGDDPKKTVALARLRRMQVARREREAAARQSREEQQNG
jgi:hypothetical protein